MSATSIEWADHSINPIRARDFATGSVGHHCEKVSPGCRNCYASRMQPRFGLPLFEVDKRRQIVPFLDREILLQPIRRRKPTRYFWCDMSDLFGEWVPEEWLDACFGAMLRSPWHTHLVLTKRAERMRQYVNSHPNLPLPSIWLGTSAEDQQRADERIPLLRQTPATVRFVSIEPLLEQVDLCLSPGEEISYPDGVRRGIHWVIVGGETGPGHRPLELAWVDSIAQQCGDAGVALFVKQDSGPWPGRQGRIPAELWARKEFPA